MKRHLRRALITVLLVSLATAFPMLAAGSGSADLPTLNGSTVDEELRDPAALARLKQATDFLSALPRFQFQARIVYDVVQEDGRLLQFEKEAKVLLQRPDRLYAEVFVDDGRHRKFWYDGMTLSVAELTRNQHAQIRMPPGIDAMLDVLEGLVRDPMPLADLLYSDLTPLDKNASEADVVGDSMVNGQACDHLAFRGEAVDWQLWIAEGDHPYVRKVAIRYREVPGQPQYVAWIDGWQSPGSYRDELFRFAVPPGSEYIKVLAPQPQRSLEGGGQ